MNLKIPFTLQKYVNCLYLLSNASLKKSPKISLEKDSSHYRYFVPF
jgi:hypothetical protein